MASEPESSRRQPKGDKRDRTRSRLLEAARSLIREKGYEQRHAGPSLNVPG